MTGDQTVRTAACVAFAYEAAAIGTGRLPTISELCRRHRGAEVLMLALLAVHLHRDPGALR